MNPGGFGHWNLLHEGSYLDHPRPPDVLLLVEVSDSTLRQDTAIKLPLYAQVRVAELWTSCSVGSKSTPIPQAAITATARSTISPPHSLLGR